MPQVAGSLPEHTGVEPDLGRREIPHGIFTGAAPSAHRFLRNLGTIDGGQLTRAHEARELHGIATIRLHAVAWLCGQEGGRNDRAKMALCRQIAREPIPAGAGFVDQDQVWSCGWQRAHELIEVDRPGANRAEAGDGSVVCWSHLGQRDGLLLHIHSDVERARLGHG
jgi:hypothetical protein